MNIFYIFFQKKKDNWIKKEPDWKIWKKKKTAERRHFFFWWEKILKRKEAHKKKSIEKASWKKSTLKQKHIHQNDWKTLFEKRHLPKKKKKPIEKENLLTQKKPLNKKSPLKKKQHWKKKTFRQIRKKSTFDFFWKITDFGEKSLLKKKKNRLRKWLLKNENFFGKTRWQKINLLKNMFLEKCWKTAGKQNLSR